MAYNNYFPIGYQPAYQQPVMPTYQPQNGSNPTDYMRPMVNVQPTPTNAQNALIWVQGESGAKAFSVAPGQTVPLWDSEQQTIYLKSADMSGMPAMKVLDYTVREEGKRNDLIRQEFDTSIFVTKEELEKRLAELQPKQKKGRLTDE